MSVAPSAGSSAARMWTLVPGWTRWRDEQDGGTGLLRGLVDVLGVGIDAVRDDVVRLLNDYFVETCDVKLIPLIGDLVGISVDPSLPVPRQRHQVKYAIHLRRRKGSVEELQTVGWQVTGFRVTVGEPPSAQRTVRDPPLSARVSATTGAPVMATTVDVSGRVPTGRVRIEMDVAWPVRRSQVELTPIGPDLHAVESSRPIGLRRADGTPISVKDDPKSLVGPGLPIEVDLIGADFDRLGPLTPRFMRLGGSAPFYVPHRTLAIDPERGRVAGPTAPTPGIQFYRRYRLHFWEPLSLEPLRRSPDDNDEPVIGEPVECTPYPHGEGVYAFASDGRVAALTDPRGLRLCLAFEGDPSIAPVKYDERLLVILQAPCSRHERRPAYVLLEPGAALNSEVPVTSQGLSLDRSGLSRFFAIEDEWGWDRFRHVRLVSEFGSESPLDDTVEVDVERGHFRINPALSGNSLRVRYFRRFDLVAMKRRGEEAVLGELPLNCAATVSFRDSAPGRTEVHRP